MAARQESIVPNTIQGPWVRQLCWLVVALLALLTIHVETYVNLVTTWWGSTAYNHCILIPFIAAWLAWQGRERLQGIAPGPSLIALAWLAANGLLWLAGELMLINLFRHVAAVGFIVGTIWALIGNRAAWALLFPLVYLYFMVPEGVFLVPYLQDWTATVLVALLRLTEIPVFLEGRYLQIPSGHFHVAKACSGVNYLLATLAVGSMYAYLNYVSNWRRFAFMLLAIAVPLLANGIRAYGIVMIAHLSDYRYAMGVDHFIYGWVFFGLVIFILFVVGRTFSDVGPATARAERAPGPMSAAVRGRPVPVVVAIALLLALPLGGRALSVQSVPTEDGFTMPRLPGWGGSDAAALELGGHFRGANRVLSASYTNADGAAVVLTLATYLEQHDGAELVHHENTVFDDRQWKLISGEGSENTGVADVPVVHARRLRQGDKERLVWWWYQVGARATHQALMAKLAEAWQTLSGTYTGAAIVVVSTPATVGTSEADRESLRAFLGDLSTGALSARRETAGSD